MVQIGARLPLRLIHGSPPPRGPRPRDAAQYKPAGSAIGFAPAPAPRALRRRPRPRQAFLRRICPTGLRALLRFARVAASGRAGPVVARAACDLGGPVLGRDDPRAAVLHIGLPPRSMRRSRPHNARRESADARALDPAGRGPLCGAGLRGESRQRRRRLRASPSGATGVLDLGLHDLEGPTCAGGSAPRRPCDRVLSSRGPRPQGRSSTRPDDTSPILSVRRILPDPGGVRRAQSDPTPGPAFRVPATSASTPTPGSCSAPHRYPPNRERRGVVPPQHTIGF